MNGKGSGYAAVNLVKYARVRCRLRCPDLAGDILDILLKLPSVCGMILLRLRATCPSMTCPSDSSASLASSYYTWSLI